MSRKIDQIICFLFADQQQHTGARKKNSRQTPVSSEHTNYFFFIHILLNILSRHILWSRARFFIFDSRHMNVLHCMRFFRLRSALCCAV